MKIAGIKAVLPSRVVTNRHIEEMVRQQSPNLEEQDLRKALRRVSLFLVYSGSQQRRWLASDETPFTLLSQAVTGALSEAQLRPDEIDLVIYTGVDRGFLEPAMAYMVASAFGMPNAHCFDVIDACMSWARSAFIAYNLLSSGKYRKVLIVNCEFNMRLGGRINPKCFKLNTVEQVNWNFAAYTLGEAASATILVRDDENPWEFHFSSANQYNDLCSIPLEGYTDYCEPRPLLALNGADCFHSSASEMFKVGKPYAIDIFKNLSIPYADIRAIFPHAASQQLWWEMGKELGVQDKIEFIYPELGNVVSASVPVALARAREAGHIHQNDWLAGWVGSAGMSFASFTFRL
jgi:acyl-CoA:acyl-CoA alkyltransferase